MYGFVPFGEDVHWKFGSLDSSVANCKRIIGNDDVFVVFVGVPTTEPRRSQPRLNLSARDSITLAMSSGPQVKLFAGYNGTIWRISSCSQAS